MPLIYVAGPLFNTHERWYLEQIAAALEAAGYTTFVPHRDAGLVDFTVHPAGLSAGCCAAQCGNR